VGWVYVLAAIVLQESARLLQHAFYFVAHQDRPAEVPYGSDFCVLFVVIFEIDLLTLCSDLQYVTRNVLL